MRTVLALAVVALTAAVASCGGGNSKQAIVLGTIYNATGSQAVLDVPSSNGARLAVRNINEAGGVLNRDLSLISVEGDSKPGTLAPEAESLLSANPDIIAMLGLSDTDLVLETAPVAARRDKVFLTSGATSPKLPEQVPSYLFLACFGDNVQAAAGAEWAYNDLGARNALVLFDPNESYPKLLQGYFVERFEGLGGTVTSVDSIEPRAATVDLPDIGNVDLVYLSVETADDAARIIPMLRDAGYTGPILGGDGYDAESVWADHPDIANVYFSTHVYLGADNPNPKVGEFLDAYAKAYPGQDPSAFAALGYDAVGLLAAAIERSGAATPSGVLKGLTGLENYQGVTGTISFPASSRIPTKSVSILKVEGGKQAFVKDLIPQSVPQP